jgi:hypothetical protein
VILELVAIGVLAITIFAFVLEPVLRARSDRVVLDAIALPRPSETRDDIDDVLAAAGEDDAAGSIEGEDRVVGERVALNRPVSSDLS